MTIESRYIVLYTYIRAETTGIITTTTITTITTTIADNAIHCIPHIRLEVITIYAHYTLSCIHHPIPVIGPKRAEPDKLLCAFAYSIYPEMISLIPNRTSSAIQPHQSYIISRVPALAGLFDED